MTAKELIAIQIERAVSDLFRSARAMPEEKLQLKIGDSTRTPLEVLQEAAQSLCWPMGLLKKGAPAFEPDAFERAMMERASWTTLEACETAAKKNLKETLEFIRTYPEEDLDRDIPLPFMPGLVLKAGELLASPDWNLTYHLGQINYVQLSYGDTEMH